jgi:hypothetical protein
MKTQACPFCESELQRGFAEMRAPRWNPFIGAGPATLSFRGAGTDFDVLVPATRKVAHLCPGCEAAVITDEPWS